MDIFIYEIEEPNDKNEEKGCFGLTLQTSKRNKRERERERERGGGGGGAPVPGVEQSLWSTGKCKARGSLARDGRQRRLSKKGLEK